MKNNNTTRFLGLIFPIIFVFVSRSTGQIAVESSLADDTEIAPGSSYEREIVIINRSNEIQQARIYQTDYGFDSEGRNYYGEPGSTDRSNAAWIHLSQSVVTIPPLAKSSVAYRVDVPSDLNGSPLDGSYWSMIMVEGIQNRSLESTLSQAPTNTEVGIKEIVRYGVQIATHVRNTGDKNLLVTSSELKSSDDGSALLYLDMENAGSRMTSTDNWVELYDAKGTTLGRFEGVAVRIYPGTSVRARYDFGYLAPGSYSALVILDSGGEDVDAIELTLTIE